MNAPPFCPRATIVFWIIDVPSRELALELAAEASKVCIGKVEVRPMMEAPE
jgi:hypothetical protein